ncbi:MULTISPECIES: hypothetical protein [Acinetobacter]|uniref:Uncharacterized protein n=1 Tax=Acinetobacter higginsii TaxID=70347 RepID=N9RAQ5_9GAMM|nr:MULTISPECIES: hypothetical protein [Acinetobacter]ENX55123.1 hypothetical protein F902_03733 [Acinetobacter higginsii]
MNLKLETSNKIYSILEEITKNEEDLKKKYPPKTSNVDISALITGIILCIFSITLVLVINLTSKNETLEASAAFLAAIGLSLIIISPLIGILTNLKIICKTLKNPLKIIFNRIKKTTEVDIEVINKLIHFDLHHLELTSLELKHELGDFNKRTTNITGQISKIGLFPATLLGLTTISTQLKKEKGIFDINNLDSLQQIIITLSISIIILYFFSIHANLKSSDLERRITILEYVINFKKNKKEIIQLN